MAEALRTAALRREIAGRLSMGMLRYVTRNYQFIEIAAVRHQQLRAIYQALAAGLYELAGEDRQERWPERLETVLCKHHERLRIWVQYELRTRGILEAVSRGLLPTCAQYSAQTQLGILGIESGHLTGPILDLGCGEDGRLVRALRRSGCTHVVGIDQNATAPDLIRGSWFEAPFPPDYWSVVLAHQSFTLHLLNAHLRSDERAVRYVAQYMTILRSLRIGGRFAYAPNLPFIERLLPTDQYRVQSRLGLSEHPSEAPAAIRELYPRGLGAAVVERIA